jgi:UDP-N-acetylmuramate: L-alanyl-gamma-D-glutamyl-meso-diaminopimelate ligase
MELVGEVGGVRVYDDFAHHPTAIRLTLEGLRNRVGDEPILAIIEPRSNTMKQGVHRDTLIPSAALADRVLWGNLSDMDWLPDLLAAWQADPGELEHHCVESSVESLIERALDGLPDTCHIVIMSNGGFGGIHRKLVAALEVRRG